MGGSGLGLWFEGARPKTLVAGAVPVLVGTAASGTFILWRFAAALVAALATQVATNYANDYFDGIKGVDTPGRKGPRRLTAEGLATPRQMKVAIAASLAVASAAGLALAAALGPALIVAGLVCFAAALGYSGGPRPYGGGGLGEVAVFIFFGLVATAGSAYVQTGRLIGLAVASAVPVGFVAVAILVVNNLRDITTDSAAGKVTLAVRLGRARTTALFRSLIAASFAAVPLIAFAARSPWPLAALAALPLALTPMKAVGGGQEPAGLVKALVATARLDMAFGVLLAAGLWLA